MTNVLMTAFLSAVCLSSLAAPASNPATQHLNCLFVCPKVSVLSDAFRDASRQPQTTFVCLFQARDCMYLPQWQMKACSCPDQVSTTSPCAHTPYMATLGLSVVAVSSFTRFAQTV